MCSDLRKGVDTPGVYACLRVYNPGDATEHTIEDGVIRHYVCAQSDAIEHSCEPVPGRRAVHPMPNHVTHHVP